MDQEHIETNVFEVQLPKPKPRGLILRIAAIVLGLGVVAVAVGVIVNRAAAPTADPLAQVMQADTMMFLSMTTHPDQQPNYAVIADAWKGSKEAKQIESALLVGLSATGFDWETDIQPWLGDRVAAGLIDLGEQGQVFGNNPTAPKFRPPFFLIAIETRNRAKSDKFLSDYRQQLDKGSSSGYYTVTLHDENYRGIPIVYQTTEAPFFSGGNAGSEVSDGAAYATVNDVIVLTQGAGNLKKVIDAALDGKNLSASGNFKTTIAALPAQNVGALYIDMANYMAAASKMTDNLPDNSAVFDNIYSSVYSGTNATPDPAIQKQIDDAKKQQETARLKQQQSMQAMAQAFGGIGFAMTYEPTGLRFDFTGQIDPSKLPDNLRSIYPNPTTQQAASNQIFDNIPASAIIAMNGNLPNSTWQLYLDPTYWSTVFATNPGLSGVDIAQKITDFEKAASINLKTDLADLFSGNVGFFMLPKSKIAAPNTNMYSFNFPFDLGAMLDSTDAARVSGSLDKIFNAVIATDKSGLQLQPMNRAPYSALLDNQNNFMLAYGPINNRFVIGSTPDTLDAIANAAQAPLSADATFKEATAVLPSDRISTGYFSFSAIWKMIAGATSNTSSFPGSEYLSAFKWLSIGAQAPSDNIERGSMHIGLQPVKQNVLSQ